MDTELFVKVETCLILGGLVLWVPLSRRVLVAWMVWLVLRWKWRHERASLRRWLWVRTLFLCDARVVVDGRRSAGEG
jgi:hypothetical protein